MPELPEVETTRRGLSPHLCGRGVVAAVVRDGRLRWPVPPDLAEILGGRSIDAVDRRGKYLLIRFDGGCLIAHLGMSGSLRMVAPEAHPRKHDHVDILLDDGGCLRFHDPRRFGCLLWTDQDPLLHPLLRELGPEPLEPEFSGEYLHDASRGREAPVKHFIMDARIVVGVGNIYANEALFRAGILPQRAAGRISPLRYRRLAESIKQALTEAIAQGGTTLRDFVNAAGRPGYFQQVLTVYDRAGEACRVCDRPIRSERLGQRATYYCPSCQR
ncbi:MAG: bifunctional DNA-formamidopyrimidine glycosylase/DNA-(apurinic or apyrimidinic site) lyase [Methylococcaceae bacterium]|nr:bifunctional DNA-formamidopyrimidine glycosylase/DNA-(apurinic or apyrimidinic site) lyase [Methylococcaceae bacterium]